MHVTNKSYMCTRLEIPGHWVFAGNFAGFFKTEKEGYRRKRRLFPTSLQYFPLNNLLYESKLPKTRLTMWSSFYLTDWPHHHAFHSSSNFKISRTNILGFFSFLKSADVLPQIYNDVPRKSIILSSPGWPPIHFTPLPHTSPLWTPESAATKKNPEKRRILANCSFCDSFPMWSCLL